MVPRESRKKGKKQTLTIESPPAPAVITEEEWESLFRRSVLLRPLSADSPPVHELTAALASGVLEIEARVTGARLHPGTELAAGSVLATDAGLEVEAGAGLEAEADTGVEPAADADEELEAETGFDRLRAAEVALEPEPRAGRAHVGRDFEAALGRESAYVGIELEAELADLTADAGVELAPARLHPESEASAPAALTEEEWRERFFKRGQLTGLLEGDELLILTAPDVAGGVTSLRLRGHALRTVAAAALRQAPAGFGWQDHDDLVLLGIVLDWWLRGVALESRPAAVRDAVSGMAERYSGFIERLTALLPPR